VGDSETTAQDQAAQDQAAQDQAMRRLEMAAKILSLMYALISVLWLVWFLIPEHKRREMAMRALRTTARTAWRTASRAGQQAMDLELSGHGTSYGVPYGLSRVAAAAEHAYEKLRYTA
jgi:hypothetical protein